MRKEEVDKMEKVADGMKLQQKENSKINEAMISEKSEKIAQLKMRRE